MAVFWHFKPVIPNFWAQGRIYFGFRFLFLHTLVIVDFRRQSLLYEGCSWFDLLGCLLWEIYRSCIGDYYKACEMTTSILPHLHRPLNAIGVWSSLIWGQIRLCFSCTCTFMRPWTLDLNSLTLGQLEPNRLACAWTVNCIFMHSRALQASIFCI